MKNRKESGKAVVGKQERIPLLQMHMKKKFIQIGVALVFIVMALVIIRYSSSSYISTKKYNNLKNEVVEKNDEENSNSQTIIRRSEKAGETQEHKEQTVMEYKDIGYGDAPETASETEPEPYAVLSDYLKHNPNLRVNHERLTEINPDYRGWLNITGTNISYPVPQGPDNEYYLHKLFETKQYEYAGSLFIDAYSYRMEDQDNLIIYGHNMKDGSMFGDLKKFKDKAYFDANPYIEFYTETGIRVYLIFSVRTADSNIKTLNYKLGSFDVQEYINHAISESHQYRNIDLTSNGFEGNPFEQIITLYTCTGESTKRLLISGIRIR